LTRTDPEDPPGNEPPPPTVPRASDAPFPPHDSFPPELIGETETDRPPATLSEVRDMIGQAMEEQRAANEFMLGRIGELFGIAQTTADGVGSLSASIEQLRTGIADQIDLEVKKRLDAHLSIVELSELQPSGTER
jgi:hypothetical protein